MMYCIKSKIINDFYNKLYLSKVFRPGMKCSCPAREAQHSLTALSYNTNKSRHSPVALADSLTQKVPLNI